MLKPLKQNVPTDLLHPIKIPRPVGQEEPGTVVGSRHGEQTGFGHGGRGEPPNRRAHHVGAVKTESAGLGSMARSLSSTAGNH